MCSICDLVTCDLNEDMEESLHHRKFYWTVLAKRKAPLTLVCMESLEDPVKMKFLVEQVWGGACDCISNKLPVELRVLVHGPLWEAGENSQQCYQMLPVG